MKNKDYISKKKQPSKSHRPQPKRPFPVLKALILIMLVSGFVYFLSILKNNNVTPEPKVTEQPSVKKEKQRVVPPIPENEEWQFIEELENKEVQVNTEELEDKGPWVLRCATVRSEERAEGLKANIAFAGYESVVKPHQGTSGMWYRVDLGPFERKREAQSISHDLKRNKIFGCKILLWR